MVLLKANRGRAMMQTDYEELTKDFESLLLNPANFGHVDHEGAAYLMLKKYDFPQAAARYSENINMIATRTGAARNFNTTVTIAYLSIIAERMQTTVHRDVYNFIECNQDLITTNPLKELYSAERLASEEARLTFLLPDLPAKFDQRIRAVE